MRRVKNIFPAGTKPLCKTLWASKGLWYPNPTLPTLTLPLLGASPVPRAAPRPRGEAAGASQRDNLSLCPSSAVPLASAPWPLTRGCSP